MLSYYENYTKKMKEHFHNYESIIVEQKKLTTEYVEHRKQMFKEIEDEFNLELHKLQYMNVVDIYLNTTNLNLPKMYWNVYVLWLKKVKIIYELDGEYFSNIMKSSSGLLQFNPFLKAYTILDVYKYFNQFKN